ncbi:MAG: ABC transporter substrate-binding protein [Clostridium sp.]|jgi:iron complex transport system substrate-binding protein|uniref:ABC transporter substrate-binding protein n=1 Tax=Clostridium sp. TaxID=1506 RepID=UPI0025BCC02A|nr:ABC transporter substrate-binding protein [Clostridium sp.]MCH3964787.1 ABC transporter substrate-binding protein [Clostridium sp.]MCI1715258.1 ABC transporter substrate-binding protein [Clostridium sp.]MCI1799520.1 ABC transporter substrate-binding protein [Clostridium sp.]MCI1813441.1 ABC transporter substrate-binding protein [Clostridium sp.]MCI1870332.1 ABC transporter substrate-binding protein [Clostridium sp.]
MRKKFNNVRNLLIIIFSAVFLFAGCGKTSTNSGNTAQESKGNVITDSTGAKVTVPEKINKIADAWPAHNEIVAMLGGSDKIVATIDSKKAYPWLYKVFPDMDKAKTIFTNTTVNTETLAQLKPDVLFMPTESKLLAKTKELGIPTVQLIFQNYDDLKKVVNTTAQVLGGDAKDKADKYNSYLDERLKAVKEVTSKIPDSQKPKILHIESFKPLTIDGQKTIVDDWIQAAGGKDAAEIEGNKKPASMEQVLKWNPDIIIMGKSVLNDKNSPIKTLDQLYSNPQWSQVNAVKNKKVYVNPMGVFLWDRYGMESALQFQWLAKLLHPDEFKNLDMVKETQKFYKEFLNYDLTADDALKILNAQNPD